MTTNGMFVRETGQGTPVVLVHGFPGNARDWGRVAGTLAASHRVIQPDLLGFGQSAKPASFEDALPRLTMPVLVAWGERDPFFPTAHAQRIAASVPHGRLKVYPGVGHFPHIEAAAQYAADIRDLIAAQ